MQAKALRPIIEFIDTQRHLNDDVSFSFEADKLPKAISPATLTAALSFLREKGAVSYKQSRTYEFVNPGHSIVQHWVERTNVEIIEPKYSEYINENINNKSKLSYEYEYGELNVFIDNEQVGRVSFNAEQSGKYEFLLKRPGTSITKELLEEYGYEVDRPIIKYFNTNRYYPALRYLFVKRNQQRVMVEKEVEITKSEAQKVIQALSRPRH